MNLVCNMLIAIVLTSQVKIGLGFMAYQPLYVVLCEIYFYTNKWFYFKQFNLA